MTDMPAGKGPYRRLLASTAWRRFTVTAGLQRMSVAMAPIALVLAGHFATGSFRVGALMASTYTFADGFVSPISGQFIDRVELRRGLSAELGAATVILAVLAGLAAVRAPAAALVVTSALAGAAPAGVMGGLRAYLQRICPDDLRDRAFALDATLLELEWMTSPSLVALTGFFGAPVLAIILMALASAGALSGARLIGRQPVLDRPRAMGGAWRNSKAMPIYILSAVLGYAEGTINIVLAPLMHLVGSRPATAALLISLLSLTSAAGGVGYAILESRRPGDPYQRANLALLGLGLGVALIAGAPSLAVLTLAIGLCGIWFAPIVTMRNIILGKLLPDSQLSEGFSTLTAAGQIGYAVSGVAASIMLGYASPRACFVVAAAITVSSTSGVWLSQRYRRHLVSRA